MHPNIITTFNRVTTPTAVAVNTMIADVDSIKIDVTGIECVTTEITIIHFIEL